nr:amidohydrolase family protein [Paracoccaceae bacterium]
AFTLHRATKGVAAARAETVLHWATMGGARVLDLPAVGRIAPGMAADIAVIDLSAPRYMGQHDAAIGPVVSGGGLHLRHLFVAGREVVADGQIPGLDLRALAHDARQATQTLIQRKEAGATPRARAAHA